MRAHRWIKQAAASAAFSLAALGALAGAAAAEDLHVGVNQARPLRLSAPAEGVAVGNPNIAAVSVQNDQLLFITGRSYGATNLVILGANGRVLYNGRVIVGDGDTNSVTLTRGSETTRLDCTPTCRPSTPNTSAGGD